MNVTNPIAARGRKPQVCVLGSAEPGSAAYDVSFLRMEFLLVPASIELLDTAGVQARDRQLRHATSPRSARPTVEANWFNQTDMQEQPEPRLLEACDLPQADIGTRAWDPIHNRDLLTVSNSGRTVHWGPRNPAYRGVHYPPAWVPAKTLLLLHSGTFGVDFVVEDMSNAQLGVGFLLAFETAK